MDTQLTIQQKPTLVSVIAWTTLASGILNVFWGFTATLLFVWTIVCIPFTLLPTVLGIFEIIYAARLLSNPPEAIQPSSTIAILEITCAVAFNFFSMVVGVLSLVFYNDITVKEYFDRLNGTLVPVAPAAPITPPAESEPVEDALQDVPVAPEETAPAEEPRDPASEETPEKPKRSRKVAKK